MVGGVRVELDAAAYDTLNTAIEATKTYWYIGEPQEPEIVSETVEP